MKKIYRNILICLMLILSVFVFASCGKKDAEKEKTTESTSEASEEAASSEDTTEATTEVQVDDEGFTIVSDKVRTTDRLCECQNSTVDRGRSANADGRQCGTGQNRLQRGVEQGCN